MKHFRNLRIISVIIAILLVIAIYILTASGFLNQKDQLLLNSIISIIFVITTTWIYHQEK